MDIDKYFYGVRRAFGYNTPEEDQLHAQRQADAFMASPAMQPQAPREAPVVPQQPVAQPVSMPNVGGVQVGGMAGQAMSEMERRKKMLEE